MGMMMSITMMKREFRKMTLFLSFLTHMITTASFVVVDDVVAAVVDILFLLTM